MKIVSNIGAAAQDIYKGAMHQAKKVWHTPGIIKDSAKLYSEVASGARTMDDGIELGGEIINKYVNKVYGKEAAEKLPNAVKNLKENADNIFDNIEYGESPSNEAILNLLKDTKKEITGTLGISSPGFYQAGRVGAAAAGYFALNTAGRAVRGGSFTHNPKGEKDIAGIPFI